MNARRLLLAALLVASTALLVRAAGRAPAAHLVNLDVFPYRILDWSGRDAEPLDAETLRVLSADSYLNRNYTGDRSLAPLNLYVAYYAVQRPGASIHSPLHCLPGTGWEPVDVATIDAPFGDRGAGQIRRMIVRRGRERALVLYWYAIHGRMLASEVASKAWQLHDALSLGQSDAALVRIVVPLAPAADAQAAEMRGLGFARAVLPYLRQLWS